MSGFLRMQTYNILGVVAMGLFFAACQNESSQSSAAERALDELQRKYGELLKDKVDVPVEWATEDIENIGDWEYRVVDLAYTSSEDLESKLNGFGNERWEVVWIEKSPGGFLVVMKKPSISYLSKIPISELGRIVTGGSEGQQ